MLAIRMQRTGRTGHAQFRVIVQDRRFSPKRGRVTAYVGSYDPHTKAAVLDNDKIADYLKNGAQPSDRVARLLQKEGLKLPAWVKLDGQQKSAIRHPEKLRRNRPAGAPAPVAEESSEPAATDESAEAAPVTTDEVPSEPTAEEAAESAEPAPAEETPSEPAESAEPEGAETPEPAPAGDTPAADA